MGVAPSDRPHKGAVLDVFEAESLTAQSTQWFCGLRYLHLTRHIAGVRDESNVRVSSMIAKKGLKH